MELFELAVREFHKQPKFDTWSYNWSRSGMDECRRIISSIQKGVTSIDCDYVHADIDERHRKIVSSIVSSISSS